MFKNWFKKSTTPEPAKEIFIDREPLYGEKVAKTAKTSKLQQKLVEMVEAQPERSIAEIIQEIHDAYDGSAKEILDESAKVIADSNIADINKGERLAKLGFKSAEKAVSAERAIKLKKRAEENAKLVQYYTQAYPFNKFITRDKVAEINKKYGLVCVPVAWYNADVPEKNLKEIEDFVVKEEDKAYQYTYYHSKGGYEKSHLTKEEYQSAEKAHSNENFRGGPEGFYISCPKAEANMPRHRGYYYDEQGFAQREIKDPIVLQPVNGGFLIVSKWGIEGQDPELTNTKLN